MRGTDLINGALFSIKASSQYKPASPEIRTAAFLRMLQWLNRLFASGITLGIPADQPPPQEEGDEIGNDPKYDLDLTAAFAPIVGPIFGRDVPKGAIREAKDAMDDLCGAFLKADLPEWPETLPTGQGNQRGPKGRVYFPVPSGLYFIPEDDTTETASS